MFGSVWCWRLEAVWNLRLEAVWCWKLELSCVGSLELSGDRCLKLFQVLEVWSCLVMKALELSCDEGFGAVW